MLLRLHYPESNFITGKFADIDYTGIEDKVLAFYTLKDTFCFRYFIQVMGFDFLRPDLHREAQIKALFIHTTDSLLPMRLP